MVNEYRDKIKERMKNPGRVSEFDVKSELDRIEEETDTLLVLLPLSVGDMAFDTDTGNVIVDVSRTTDTIHRTLKEAPGTDWRAFLRRMVKHELVHKKQFEYLKAHGVSKKEQNESYYKYLKEFHAHNKVPRPVWEKVYKQSFREAEPEEIREGLELPRIWANSVMAFDKEEIRDVFRPFDAAKSMLELKEIAEKVQTEGDIIKYAEETRKLLFE